MSAEHVVYSIQKTYIIKPVSKPEKRILTCDERIDIPTIEPLPSVKPVFYDGQPLTVIPCIELAGEFFSEFDLTFETNEGVTVLPERIVTGMREPLKNPYTHVRYVLALPRGTTGVRTCKLIHKATGKEVQNNLTFSVMPPPYNYDNILFGYIMNKFVEVGGELLNLQDTVSRLKLSTKPLKFEPVSLPKGAGKQTINIKDGMLYFGVSFEYPYSEPPKTHSPKITVSDGKMTMNCTLSLVGSAGADVIIDLLTGTITAFHIKTGEIVQQRKIFFTRAGYKTITFENFDDTTGTILSVFINGCDIK